MTAHDAIAACGINGGATANKTLTRNLLTARMPYVLADSDDMQDLVAVDPSTGAAIIDVIYLGRVYHYDAADTTTAHDGVTCLVSDEGRRYKLADGSDVDVYSVSSFTTTATPGSPSLGDAYLLPASCTGAWAGHEGGVAVYTARGWEYITVPVGRAIYVEDELAYYHRDAAGDWTAGLGSQLFTTNSIAPSALVNYKIGGRIKVINATTNSPPGSPAVGDAYVIGPSPTGAWAGKSLQVALRETSSSWGYYTPTAGDEIYNIATGEVLTYSGSAWSSSINGMVVISTQVASGSATIDFTGIDGTYDSYLLMIDAVQPTTDAVSFGMRVGTGATPTWVTTGYKSVASFFSSAAGFDSASISSTDRIIIGADGTNRTAGTSYNSKLGNATGENLRCRITFSKPADNNFILFDIVGSYVGSDGDLISFTGSGMRNTAAAITALRFLTGSGTISTGRFTLYGMRA